MCWPDPGIGPREFVISSSGAWLLVRPGPNGPMFITIYMSIHGRRGEIGDPPPRALRQPAHCKVLTVTPGETVLLPETPLQGP